MPEIKYVTGDATKPEVAPPDRAVIVHVVNDIGAWGTGFVIPLGKRYPKARQAYLNWSEGVGTKKDNRLPLGAVYVVPVGNGISVAHLVGQRGIMSNPEHPPIRYDAIRQGFQRLARWGQNYETRFSSEVQVGQEVRFHMPRLGCGLAGGSWAKIEPLIQEELSSKGYEVTVYDFPGGRYNP